MYKLLVLISFTLPSFLFAQQGKTFSIIGHSTFYNNQRLAIQGGMFQASYDDFEFAKDNADSTSNSYRQVQVLNNQFTVSGTLKYPHPFVISYYDAENNRGFNSYWFFIDEGTVNIELGDLSKIKSLGTRLSSKLNDEYSYLKKLYCNSQDTLTNKIYDMQAKQETIRKYITKNPNSYVALWDMILDYPLVRNTDEKESILRNTQFFSVEIKKTKTYLAFVNNIQHDLELIAGNLFPNIPLNETDSLFSIISKNKFTLVDFWFSGCEPCLAQFPNYKKIYTAFKEHQFEIVGISVDTKKAIVNWQNIIKTFHLKWLQYLDIDGKKTDKLFIRKFPTNFLLNRKGEIIRKDISPEDLDIFLRNNLIF